jgi:hypothetical protein
MFSYSQAITGEHVNDETIMEAFSPDNGNSMEDK